MTTDTHFVLFSRFPTDIQRLIFEEAFEASHRKAVDLVLVSREVRFWIEPLIYQSVVLNRHTYTTSERRRFCLFKSTFHEGCKPADFYTKYVRSVFIDDLGKWNLAKDFLPLCSKMTSLACWARPTDTSQAILRFLFSPDAHYFPRLRRLSIYWEALPTQYRSFYHPIFKNLTHLDVDFMTEISWNGLATLENLLYLNLDCISACTSAHSTQDVADTLDYILTLIIPHLPPSLRCFVVLVPSTVVGSLASDEVIDTKAQQIFSEIVSGQYDQRIVLGSSPKIPKAVMQLAETRQSLVRYIVPVPYNLYAWTYLPPGSTDFWMEAEGIIQNREREREERRHKGDNAIEGGK